MALLVLCEQIRTESNLTRWRESDTFLKAQKIEDTLSLQLKSNVMRVYHPMGRDDEPTLTTRDCCIMTNSGALRRMKDSLSVPILATDRRTDRQMDRYRLSLIQNVRRALNNG